MSLIVRIQTLLKRIKFLRNDPLFRRPRLWSNLELKKIAPHFRGSIINVSGWADEDKFGDAYCNYFVNAQKYIVSNLGGGLQKGIYRTLEDSVNIDLNIPLGKEHYQAYDCVFLHTVFEHVFNIFQAVKNACEMSRDSIIIIVPFVQAVHWERDNPNGYSDYWRFTPFCIEKLFQEYGFTTIYRNGLDIPGSSLYYLYVLSKHPENYSELLAPLKRIEELPLGSDIYTTARMKNMLKYLWFRQNDFIY